MIQPDRCEKVWHALSEDEWRAFCNLTPKPRVAITETGAVSVSWNGQLGVGPTLPTAIADVRPHAR